MKKKTKPFKNMVIYTEKDFEKFKKKPVPMKKETIEEVAESYWLNDDSMTNNDRISYVNGFLTGAKWQQERSYSEEDLEKAFKSGFTNCYNNNNLTFGEWFEQFKKK